ncbi:MAG: crossover junction endodeoxyribonuclease RuvC [Candidatus Dadabacteria bacterium]
MRVIGIDPGSRVCGYGVLESENGGVTHIASGCIKASPGLPVSKRLSIIYDGLLGIIKGHSPLIMSVESMFFSKNARSAITLGEARGVALLAASMSGIDVCEYSPTKVKLALTGRGRASKSDVRRMITMLLEVPEFESEDASDAVAIALCHLHISRIEQKLGKEFLQPRRKRRRFTLDDIPS